MFAHSRLNKTLVIVLLLALIMLLPTTTYAQGGKDGDKVVFGGNYTLATGKTLDGDLTVLGGTVDIQTNAVVMGDVAIIGGTANIDGHIRGDVAAIGGFVNLNAHAVVDGDATAIGGRINRDANARIHGDIIGTDGNSDGPVLDGTPVAPPLVEQIPIPRHPRQESSNWFMRTLFRALSAIAWTAVLAALGMILVLIAPAATERMADTMQNNLLLAFGVGLATVILSVPVIALLSITICLIPVALLIPLILLGTFLLGWLALGWLLGRELLKAANIKESTPIWEALVGVAILTMLWQMPHILPFVGGVISGLVVFVAGNIAIGGALLTRFGTRKYPTEPTVVAAPESVLPATSTLPPEPQQPIIPPPPPAPEED